jgi:hypothetical protein
MSSRFGFHPYVPVLFFVLTSAIVGAVGGYYFALLSSSAPAPADSVPDAQAYPARGVGANAFSDANGLVLEQRGLVQAQKENAAALSASVSAPVLGSQVQDELRQEIRDLRQMQRSLRPTVVALSAANTSVPAVAAERYTTLNKKQIEQLETLP